MEKFYANIGVIKPHFQVYVCHAIWMRACVPGPMLTDEGTCKDPKKLSFVCPIGKFY